MLTEEQNRLNVWTHIISFEYQLVFIQQMFMTHGNIWLCNYNIDPAPIKLLINTSPQCLCNENEKKKKKEISWLASSYRTVHLILILFVYKQDLIDKGEVNKDIVVLTAKTTLTTSSKALSAMSYNVIVVNFKLI